jgi:hypothetical protein
MNFLGPEHDWLPSATPLFRVLTHLHLLTWWTIRAERYFLSTLIHTLLHAGHFLQAVQLVTRVEHQPAVVGSHKAANKTRRTHLEIDGRACNETVSLTDTLDPHIVPSCGVREPHQGVQSRRTWRGRCHLAH